MQDSHQPPKWALRLLRVLLRNEYVEEIEGDMEEIMRQDHAHLSPSAARQRYLLDLLLLMRPSLLRKLKIMPSFYDVTLLRNYVKTGWRNFMKYKTYSAINVFGLAVGFTACLLLFVTIRHEYSYDAFHERHKQLYRVGTMHEGGDISDMIVTPQVPLMQEEYPDIVRGSRFMAWEDILQHEDKFVRSIYHIVDSSFADMFDFPLLRGDLKRALSAPDRIALTKTLAEKLFGNKDPLGQEIALVNEGQQLIVEAITADPPKNSTLQFDALIPWHNAPPQLDGDQWGNWYNTFMTGYVELAPGSSRANVEDKLIQFKEDHFLEERRATSDIVLLPLEEEHFRGGSSRRLLTILGIIAIAILLISCINFMNLSISQLLQRTKEIGVRKVMGGRPSQLVLQFMGESLIVSLSALLLAVLASYFILPTMSAYFDFGVDLRSMDNLPAIGFLLGICLFASILSSCWPSIMLAGVRSVDLVKNALSWNTSGGIFRKGMMTLQFAASIFLVIGAVIIWKQIDHMRTHDLHFDGDLVLTTEYYPELFRSGEEATARLQTIRAELESHSAVASITTANGVPGSYSENYNWFESLDTASPKGMSLRQLTVDDRFFETFNINLKVGRDFLHASENDKKAVIINEEAMKQYGWDDLDEKYLKPGHSGETTYQVIGVTENYFYRSLQREIEPLIHFYHPDAAGILAVRLQAGSEREGIQLIEDKWASLEPYEPFSYSFVDDAFDQLYKEHERLGTTAGLFSLIAIVLAILGLFSLSAYSIRLRTKEIGIRKVLGASVGHLIVILSRSYGLLILLGFLLACPLVYVAMQAFLQDFAHRIPLSLGVFVAGGTGVFLLAMCLVGVQTHQAAAQNPVQSLRDE